MKRTKSNVSRWIRTGLHVFVAVGLAGFLSGSSCHVHARSCHDDDHRDGCDHGGSHSSEAGGELDPLRLHSFRAVPGDSPERHAIRAVTDIVGTSIRSVVGSTDFGAEDLARFTSGLLEENPELFGLPPEAGRLVPAGVAWNRAAIVVTYDQRAAGTDGRDWGTGGSVRFLFAHTGALVRVDNTTLVDIPSRGR